MFLGAKYNPHLPQPSIYILHLMYLSVFFLIYRGALQGFSGESQNNTFLLQDVSFCVHIDTSCTHAESTLNLSCCQSTFIVCRQQNKPFSWTVTPAVSTKSLVLKFYIKDHHHYTNILSYSSILPRKIRVQGLISTIQRHEEPYLIRVNNQL